MTFLSRGMWVPAGLLPLLVVLSLLDVRLGSLTITFGDIIRHLVDGEGLSESQLTVLTRFRLPRLATALLTGAALPACGLMMQTLFRNPLAGPYVLGISSGASFGAAIVVLASGATGILATWSLALSAWAGAGAVMILLLAVSVRIKDSMTLLILGIMFSSGLGAVISILQYFSEAEALKSFVIWSLGSLGHVTGPRLQLMTVAILPLLILSLGLSKSLDGMMLGEEYAATMGLRVIRLRSLILITTSILAGTVTAFCGPIGFIGIAVPHITRIFFGSGRHRVLLPATMLTGMVIMVFSDLVSQLPGSERMLPISAVTSLIGIPVVFWLVLVNRKTRAV